MITNKNDLTQFTEDLNEKIETSFETLAAKYIPNRGKADTVGGELLRAVSRIEYRYYNDGDIAGIGYGKETVNPAVRFLIAKGDDNVSSIAESMFSIKNDRMYEFAIKELKEFVPIQIKEFDLLNQPNEEDMLSYRTEEDIDDGDEDEDF